MFDNFGEENSIKTIATLLPEKLVKIFYKKEFYTPHEVETVFSEVFESDNNIEYAMFCSQKRLC
jgi:hypothetical protein